MTTSSPTPEGAPLYCEICGEVVVMETSAAGDTLCPACGTLLWEFKNHLGMLLNIPADELDLQSIDTEIAHDSIGAVELVMSAESVWGHLLQEDDISEARSLRELLQRIRPRQREQNENDSVN